MRVLNTVRWKWEYCMNGKRVKHETAANPSGRRGIIIEIMQDSYKIVFEGSVASTESLPFNTVAKCKNDANRDCIVTRDTVMPCLPDVACWEKTEFTSIYFEKHCTDLWSTPSASGVSLNDVSLGAHAHPSIVDIDGDGDLDFFFGTTHYFENVGTSTTPIMQYRDSVMPFGALDFGVFASLSWAKVGGKTIAYGGDGEGGMHFFQNISLADDPIEIISVDYLSYTSTYGVTVSLNWTPHDLVESSTSQTANSPKYIVYYAKTQAEADNCGSSNFRCGRAFPGNSSTVSISGLDVATPYYFSVGILQARPDNSGGAIYVPVKNKATCNRGGGGRRLKKRRLSTATTMTPPKAPEVTKGYFLYRKPDPNENAAGSCSGTFSTPVACDSLQTSTTCANIRGCVWDNSHLVGGNIILVDRISAADNKRKAGTYKVTTFTGGAVGSSGAEFSITVDGSGAATVAVLASGVGYRVNDSLTVSDSQLGSGGGANLTFDVKNVKTAPTAAGQVIPGEPACCSQASNYCYQGTKCVPPRAGMPNDIIRGETLPTGVCAPTVVDGVTTQTSFCSNKETQLLPTACTGTPKPCSDTFFQNNKSDCPTDKGCKYTVSGFEAQLELAWRDSQVALASGEKRLATTFYKVRWSTDSTMSTFSTCKAKSGVIVPACDKIYVNNNNDCSGRAGCTWNAQQGVCTGTATPCTDATMQSSQANCTVSNGCEFILQEIDTIDQRVTTTARNPIIVAGDWYVQVIPYSVMGAGEKSPIVKVVCGPGSLKKAQCRKGFYCPPGGTALSPTFGETEKECKAEINNCPAGSTTATKCLKNSWCPTPIRQETVTVELVGSARLFDRLLPGAYTNAIVSPIIAFKNRRLSTKLDCDSENECIIEDGIEWESGSIIPVVVRVSPNTVPGLDPGTRFSNRYIVTCEVTPVNAANVQLGGTTIEIDPVSGIGVFDKLRVTVPPGSTASLSMSCSAVPNVRPSPLNNYPIDAYMKGIVDGLEAGEAESDLFKTFSEIRYFSVKLRECRRGEIQVNNVCTACEAGTYSWEEPVTQGTRCKPCPAPGAWCPGGDVILAQKQYWRESTNHTTFYRCFNEWECLGVDINAPPKNFTDVEKCLLGHNGVLCATCENGYIMSPDEECHKCAAREYTLIAILGGLMLFLFFLVFLCFFTRKPEEGPNYEHLREPVVPGGTARRMTTHHLKKIGAKTRVVDLVLNAKVDYESIIEKIEEEDNDTESEEDETEFDERSLLVRNAIEDQMSRGGAFVGTIRGRSPLKGETKSESARKSREPQRGDFVGRDENGATIATLGVAQSTGAALGMTAANAAEGEEKSNVGEDVIAAVTESGLLDAEGVVKMAAGEEAANDLFGESADVSAKDAVVDGVENLQKMQEDNSAIDDALTAALDTGLIDAETVAAAVIGDEAVDELVGESADVDAKDAVIDSVENLQEGWAEDDELLLQEIENIDAGEFDALDEQDLIEAKSNFAKAAGILSDMDEMFTSMTSKFKILIEYLQIISQFRFVLEVPWPKMYLEWMSILNFLSLDFIDLFSGIEGKKSPIFSRFTSDHDPKCEEVGGVEYLRRQMEIVCEFKGTWGRYNLLSMTAGMGYCVFIPLFYMYFLYRNRAFLAHPHDAPHRVEGLLEDEEVMRKYRKLLARFGSVFSPYTRGYWQFEFFTLLRKLILTGVLVLIAEGSATRIAVGLLVCFVYLIVLCNVAPFYDPYDDMLAQLAGVLLFLSLLCGLILKTDWTTEGRYEHALIEILLIIMNVSIVLIGIFVLIMSIPPIRRRAEKWVHKLTLKRKRRKSSQLKGRRFVRKLPSQFDLAKKAEDEKIVNQALRLLRPGDDKIIEEKIVGNERRKGIMRLLSRKGKKKINRKNTNREDLGWNVSNFTPAQQKEFQQVLLDSPSSRRKEKEEESPEKRKKRRKSMKREKSWIDLNPMAKKRTLENLATAQAKEDQAVSPVAKAVKKSKNVRFVS
eukprot:g5167.t1